MEKVMPNCEKLPCTLTFPYALTFRVGRYGHCDLSDIPILEKPFADKKAEDKAGAHLAKIPEEHDEMYFRKRHKWANAPNSEIPLSKRGKTNL